MATITTRSGKGSALTHQEVDANFTGLNTELGQKELASNKGVANGYASLDAAGKVPSAQLPSYVDDVVEAANLASLPGTGETGKIYVTLDTNKTYRWSGSAYVEISPSPGSTDSLAEGSTNLYFTQARARASVSASGSLSYNSSTGVFSFSDAVTSVAGRTGAVTLTSSDVGLGNVENKSSATIRGELTSSNVTTALGFTPYNSSNPSGYLTDAMRNRGSVAQASVDSATLDGFYTQNNPGDSDGVLVFNSGGSLGPLQMRFKYTGLFEFRNKTDSANWNSWKQVLHSANYNSYSPTLTGTGASGTWGISITGTARGVGTSDPALGTGGLWVTTGTGLNVARNNTAYLVLDAGNYSSYSAFSGLVTSSGNNGFANATWFASVRNPIWSFGNASSYGISYFQGSAGRDGTDTITLHPNGSTTATGATFATNSNNAFVNNNVVLHAGNYSSYALPLSGGTMSGALNFASIDQGAVLQHNGNASAWYGRILTKNATNDRAAFLGTYAGIAGVFAHNNALNAWADLYVNTVNGSDGGTVRLPSSVLVNGSQAIHAGNYSSYSLPLSGGTVTGVLTATGGSKITVQGATDGGSSRGIMLWQDSDTNWGIYMAQSGSGRSLSNASAPASIDGRTAHAVRFRAYGSDALRAFIWENDLNQCVASLTPDTGNFYTRGQMYAGNSTTNLVLHTGNYSSYALPLSGGTMTGNLSVNGFVKVGNHGGSNAYDSGSGASLYFGGDTAGAYRIWTSFENVGGNYTKLNIDWHTGIRIGAYWAYGGIRFYNDSLGYGGANGYGNKVFSVAEGDSHVRVYNNLYVGGNLALHAGNYSSYALPLSGGTMSGHLALNDSRLYLRTNGDTNHYLWNSDDDWEELVAWQGTGFRVKSTTGTNLLTASTSAVNAGVALQQGGNQVLHAGNYTSYAPSLGGVGATGNWAINVSGSSNSVVGLTLTSSANGVNPDSVTQNQIGYNTSVSLFGQTDGGLYSSAYSSAWVHQIFGDFRTGQIAVRGKNSGTWQSWRAVLDASNYSSYALPLSGGTVTGTANFSASTYPVFVYGNSDTSGAVSKGLQVYSTDANGAVMAFHRGGYYAVNMGLDSDNVFRIGGWSASANRLQMDMSGNLTMAGNVTAYSDERLKRDWSDIENGLVERLAVMRCGTYTRIDSGQRQAGVSAQNMREILPEVVSEDNDGTLALAYGNAALVSAVELAKELVALKHKVAELEARVH